MNRHYLYSNREYYDMVRFYAISRENLSEARRLYADPQHMSSLRASGIVAPQVPRPETILATVQRLLDHGQFRAPLHARGAGPPPYELSTEDDVIQYFEEDPRRSTRMAARRFGVSRFYVWNLLKSEGLHPYHFRRAQALYDGDEVRRINFCHWLVQHPNLNILWTDESTFTRIGLFNIHNEHWWTYNNPHVIREHSHQVRFSVNVWAGIINDRIIGPVFIEGRLSGRTYLQMLQEVLPELMDRVPLAYLRGLHYQHDGCPAHYERSVRNHLNAEFDGRWIGRGSPTIEWPPRSPDLTPLDFYLWSEVKKLVYAEECQSLLQLKRRIRRAFKIVKRDRDTLNNLNRHLLKRARLCISENGHQFEQLL